MIPKSCIFYLVNENSIHLRRLYKSLELLKENFLDQYNYPVVFGYENLESDVIDNIKRLVPNNYFYKINFEVPSYPQPIKDAIPEQFKGHWDEGAYFSMGYRHMCRLFAGDIYKQLFFDNVKYLWRLDCDSYLTEKVTYDPFEIMFTKNIRYGYIGEEQDMDYVTEGLEDQTRLYFGTNYKPVEHLGMFQTHFEIVDVQWIKNSEYMKYYDFMEQTGNIYVKRWGDAPIKYQGMKNVLSDNEMWKFILPYRHGGDY